MKSKEKQRVNSLVAERALREAQVRREARERTANIHPPEIDGREGPDPVRYGDWEKGGIASGF